MSTSRAADRKPAPTSDRLAAEAEALFREARRRARRRRLRRLSVAVTILVSGFLILYVGFDRQATTSPSATPRPLVNSAAFSHQGILAFVSEGRLWVLDGETGKLTGVSRSSQQALDPQFSPNGRWLSYLVGTGQLWLARSDGRSPRRVGGGRWGIGGENWLPDGRLLTAAGILQVSASGAVRGVGAAPDGLEAWSPDGGRYAFTSGSRVALSTTRSVEVERLEVSSSLSGRRTTWYENRVSFTAQSGLAGGLFDGVIVLSHQEGILFRLDPGGSNSIAADGLSVYEIRGPGAQPKPLGVSLGDVISVGSNGAFTFTNGGDRYAWLTKSVQTCSAATARCSAVHTTPGQLSFDPTWSPDGKTLAFVQAPSGSASDFFQRTLRRWYATHSLWVLRQGSATPVEITDANGASVPIWSANGTSLLYEADDALWLLPTLSSKPVRIASPLFTPNHWPSYYGQISWSGQFAWLSHAAG
jgi:WD40-like Beta Propeller Repeat